MNTCIISMNGHNNYGNRLQIYALQTVLKRYGNCKNLWWQNSNFEYKTQFTLKEKIKFLINYHNYQHSLTHELPLELVRQFQIKKFSDSLIDIEYIKELKKNISEQYDYFIAGSDQIWNPYFWYDTKEYSNAFFLQFAIKEKRIAYAASFGLSSLPKQYEKQFTTLLNSIEHISVREQAGADIVKNLTGRDVPVVLDPTLLISSSHWESIEIAPNWYQGEKYLLTYFLGDTPESVKVYAKKRNLKIYNLTDINNIDLYTSRVEEFIYLIHHCELFFTDSFHGCVFAIQYRKSFIVMDRNQSGLFDMTSRIDTILETFNLKDRYLSFSSSVAQLEKLLDLDYSHVDEILNKERIKSIEFLEKAMRIAPKC